MSPWEHFFSKAESLDELVRWLERFLSSEDYVVEENGKLYVVETRAKVAKVESYSIEIYPGEHSPPHFHIVKNGIKLASYTIDDCTRLNGNLPSGIERKIRYFYQSAKDKLILFWNNSRPCDDKVINSR